MLRNGCASNAPRMRRLLLVVLLASGCGKDAQILVDYPERFQPPPMTRQQAEAIVAGFAGVGILSIDATTQLSPTGTLTEGSVACPAGGIMEITDGSVRVTDEGATSLAMTTQANMTPVGCMFSVPGDSFTVRINIPEATAPPSLEHNGRLTSDSTSLYIDVREFGHVDWGLAGYPLPILCWINTRVADTISLVEPPAVPYMRITGTVCGDSVSVSVPLYTGILISS